MDMGRGRWEHHDTMDLYDNYLRIAVAAQDGSVVIIDEELEVVASFP